MLVGCYTLTSNSHLIDLIYLLSINKFCLKFIFFHDFTTQNIYNNSKGDLSHSPHPKLNHNQSNTSNISNIYNTKRL